MSMLTAMILLLAFVISIMRETREYLPTVAGSFDHYVSYLYDHYGGPGFFARCVLLAAAEGLFLHQIIEQQAR